MALVCLMSRGRLSPSAGRRAWCPWACGIAICSLIAARYAAAVEFSVLQSFGDAPFESAGTIKGSLDPAVAPLSLLSPAAEAIPHEPHCPPRKPLPCMSHTAPTPARTRRGRSRCTGRSGASRNRRPSSSSWMRTTFTACAYRHSLISRSRRRSLRPSERAVSSRTASRHARPAAQMTCAHCSSSAGHSLASAVQWAYIVPSAACHAFICRLETHDEQRGWCLAGGSKMAAPLLGRSCWLLSLGM